MKTYKIKCCVCSKRFESSRPHTKTCSASCRVKLSQEKTIDAKLKKKVKEGMLELFAMYRSQDFKKENPSVDVESLINDLTSLFGEIGIVIKKGKLIKR